MKFSSKIYVDVEYLETMEKSQSITNPSISKIIYMDLDFMEKSKQQMNQGWVCPLCNRVYAPIITQCNCKRELK